MFNLKIEFTKKTQSLSGKNTKHTVSVCI